ncbi:MAG TPA: DMT family transporter [Gaiellaceae bacterium]
MIAIVAGLGAALCWAAATLCAAKASRLIGARSVLAWVMLTGLAITLPIAAFSGIPRNLHGVELTWIVLAGSGNVAGLLLAYEAMSRGKVSIVAPISSTEGAIAALLAVATGEALGLSSAVLLALIAAGVVLASLTSSDDAVGGHTIEATLLAAAAACSFGVSLFATARVSNALPLVWAVLPPRVVGVTVVALPLLAARRVRIEAAAVPLVLTSGVCEVAGFTAFSLGARHSIAVSAVLASQFAAFAALAAFFLFRERLRTAQVFGITMIAVCVALLSAIRA